MNPLTPLLIAPVLAIAPLLDPVPEPGEVKPGLVAALVVGGLIVVTFLLWLSMRKQLTKIRFQEEPEDRGPASGSDTTGSENGSTPR